MRVSGFTFVHNAMEGGYPIVEAIEAVYPFVDDVLVVDMESTDGTMDVIATACHKLGLHNVYKRQGEWTPGAAGECLKKAHALHRHCNGDVIIHFEADEVFSPSLIEEVHRHIGLNHQMTVYRLQVEQNFQRIRWYPELVHRVFPNDGSAIKRGHTTTYHDGDLGIHDISPEHGFLWDVTNCFRDNWIQRYRNQAELWGHDVPTYCWTGEHATYGWIRIVDHDRDPPDLVTTMLKQPHWIWGTTPIALPHNLVGMVGTTSYREHLERRGLL